VILDTNEPFENRLDLCEGDQWLQVSVLKLPAAKKGQSAHSPTPPAEPGGQRGHHAGMLDHFARRNKKYGCLILTKRRCTSKPCRPAICW